MSIKYIDIIHHSHTDFGYTDHPAVARELQKRYIDMALDAIKATAGKKPQERFYWTAEVMAPLYEWWQQACDARRNELLAAIESGQFEVTGFAFNNTAFMNDDEWDMMLNWIPYELWEKFRPSCCIQNDVNGIPVAGVMRALKKGIRYLWAGPNNYIGGAPFKQPSAFRWKMPDGSSIFVWLNAVYCNAHYLFNENWRVGPVSAAADLRYRKPEKGDIFSTEKDDILKAHRRCIENIKILESVQDTAVKHAVNNAAENTHITASGGYEYERLPVSMTNQWRMDNDPPFTPLVEFITKWNEMGLEPVLRITTPTVAMADLERETGGNLPEYAGEWVDWWANGSPSAPVDIAASRKAKRIVKACKSQVFGRMEPEEAKKIDSIIRDLCMFDEHTWGSWGSVAYPYSMDTIGQMYEKGSLAYRPLAMAELLLADRTRKKFEDAGDGVYAANSSSIPVRRWIELPSDCLRGSYTHVQNENTGEISEIFYADGIENFVRPQSPESLSFQNVSRTFSDRIPGRKARFWTGVIWPGAVNRYVLLKVDENTAHKELEANLCCCNAKNKVIIKADHSGWPEMTEWEGMGTSLFDCGFGEFISLKAEGLAPRWVMRDVFGTANDEERKKKREEMIKEESAEYKNMAVCSETPYTIEYEQVFSHPSLEWGIRRLEIMKDEPQVRLSVKINRRPSMDPEIFYIKFPLACKRVIPRISNGGHVFKPEEGQLPGSCMDYYAIDGWVHYTSKKGNWVWSGTDSAMITFGAPQSAARLKKLPEKTEVLLAMVFDNTWDTNFVADSHGIMEFNYDLIWKESVEDGIDAGKLAEGLTSEPVVLVKAG